METNAFKCVRGKYKFNFYIIPEISFCYVNSQYAKSKELVFTIRCFKFYFILIYEF